MKNSIRVLKLLIAGFLVLSSCENSPKKKNGDSANRKTETKEVKRISIGNTGLSLISKYKWNYSSTYSKLSDADKRSYLSRETYQSELRAGYCLVNYSVAKDGINLYLKNGLAGAISGLANTSNTVITNRVDTILDSRYGFPAIYSKGEAIAKTAGGRNMEYRILAIQNKQKMYMIIGLFKPTEKTLIRIFEETLPTIQIK